MKKIKSKKLTYVGTACLFLIITAFFIVGSLKDSPSEVTGSSVYVRYYGISDQLMENKAGNLQTYIKLEQPTLMNMGKIQEGDETRNNVANDIINSVNFVRGITDLYQNNAPVTIRHGSLETVSAAAALEADNFKSDTTCLKNIGENHGHVGAFEVFLVSELKFQKCTKDPGQLYAYVKHTFFKKEGNRFICGQEGDKLFLIRITDGKINSDTSAC